mgnify:CR=1 FL=1
MQHPTRRHLLQVAGVGLTGLAALAGRSSAQEQVSGVSTSSVSAAEKVAGVEFTSKEREQMLGAIDDQLSAIQQLRAFDKPNDLAPAQTFDPRLKSVAYDIGLDNLDEPPAPTGPAGLPRNDDDIAFAPMVHLSAWIGNRLISSRRLTDIYLARIEALDPILHAWITVMPDRARAEADEMDAELAAGRYRGPLHGIPYGLKDLFDAKGAPSTWGATPYKDREPATTDATIVAKLKQAGAVLLGKTTCGALAYGDIWFDGVTRNPFDPREGSSGSSAGSASSVAAGLCAFAIGTETLGSLLAIS